MLAGVRSAFWRLRAIRLCRRAELLTAAAVVMRGQLRVRKLELSFRPRTRKRASDLSGIGAGAASKIS